MTIPEDQLGRLLHAEADHYQPSADGMEKIRGRVDARRRGRLFRRIAAGAVAAAVAAIVVPLLAFNRQPLAGRVHTLAPASPGTTSLTTTPSTTAPPVTTTTAPPSAPSTTIAPPTTTRPATPPSTTVPPTTTTVPPTTVAPSTTTTTPSQAILPPAKVPPLVFPDTSIAQAQAAQAAEANGTQPWRLDPASVAAAYGSALGWTTSQSAAVVTEVNASTYDITNPRTGEALRLFMIQPVQAGPGGIWDISVVQQVQPPTSGS